MPDPRLSIPMGDLERSFRELLAADQAVLRQEAAAFALRRFHATERRDHRKSTNEGFCDSGRSPPWSCHDVSTSRGHFTFSTRRYLIEY